MALQDEAKELIEAARIEGALAMFAELMTLDDRPIDTLMNDDSLRPLAHKLRIPYVALHIEFSRFVCTSGATPQEIDELAALPMIKRLVWERAAAAEAEDATDEATA